MMKIQEHLEPFAKGLADQSADARGILNADAGKLVCQVSAAISAKRQADALERIAATLESCAVEYHSLSGDRYHFLDCRDGSQQ